MNLKQTVITIAAITSLAFSGLILAKDGPPEADVNVVNTPDVNVVNTPGVNVLNTISAENLEGIDALISISTPGTIFVSRLDPASLRAISTSIVPDVSGTLCTASVRLPEDPFDVPIGFSVMANGQAGNVSRHYDIPIEGVSNLIFDIRGDADLCSVLLSVTWEVTTDSMAAEALAGAAPIQIEVR